MILWDIIEEHLDEASFLWTRWERALLSPRYSLREVMEGPEARLLAHVDGLLECGPPVVERLLAPALAEEDPGRFCAAALTLLSLESGAHLDGLLGEFGSAAVARQACIRRVLELARGDAVTARLMALLQEGRGPVSVLAAALDALSARNEDPRIDLNSFLTSAEPLLNASALRASGRWRRPLEHAVVLRALDSPVSDVRDAAVEAGLRMGSSAAWIVCQRLCAALLPDSGHAMLLLALGGQAPQDVHVLTRALSVPGLREDAIRALGASGWPEAAEVCLPLLRDEGGARLAGEAFSTITGLRLAGSFSREAPEKDEGWIQEATPEDLVPGVQEELPLPEPGSVEAWWADARKRFTPGTRYFDGQPMTAELVVDALHHAPMARRPALALEVEIRSQGAWQLQPREFAHRQSAQVARLRPDLVGRLQRPFVDLLTKHGR